MAKQKHQQNKPINQKTKSTAPKKSPINFHNSSKSTSKQVDNKQALRWLIWGGSLVTLAMWLSLNDPFNAPKSWVLSIAAFWLLGWLAFNFKFYTQNKVLKQATYISIFFLATLVLAFIATDNKFVGFFGLYGRKTGLLTYASFLIFFLAATFLIRLDQIAKLERTVVFLGSILGIYGFFQHYKIDFVKWNYLYNSVLGTLGNPDFAGAIMAILLVLNFGIAVQKARQIWFRSLAAFNVLLLAIVIVFSQARQGLLAAGLGTTFIVLVWIYQRNKRASLALSAISVLSGLVVIAGLLKMGPLTRFFYKVSVTYRGDYWRAAVRMFIHHPFFGVGLDRYGAYFRQYRDATQSLRRGPLIVADAAHDVPLQLVATGGIFVLIAFLLLTAFTVWRGVVALRNTQGAQQILVAVIFGSWITYQAQSLISIDNIGIAIWGYILGGALIGLSIAPNAIDAPTQTKSEAQPVISILLTLVITVLSFLFFQSESAFHTLSSFVPPKSASVLKEYESLINKPLSYIFKEPSFVLTSARDYNAAGDSTKAIATLKGLITSDPRNTEAISTLAAIFRSEKNWASTITLDKQLVALDPYNQIDLLQLGRDEKSSGDLTAARAVIPLINAFAPNSTEAKQAQTEFGQ
jgi:O-antigen ligase